jgi:hypothetical protein
MYAYGIRAGSNKLNFVTLVLLKIATVAGAAFGGFSNIVVNKNATALAGRGIGEI